MKHTEKHRKNSSDGHRIAILWIWACFLSSTVGSFAESLSVLVSVPPQKFIVERIGGEHVKVDVLLPPGRGPEAFEITPRHMMRLAESDLFCRIGVAFEQQCLDRLMFEKQNLRVMNMADGLTLLDCHSHNEDHNHSAHVEGKDPHVWTSPRFLKVMAKGVAEILAEMCPEHGDEFSRNMLQLEQELNELDKSLRHAFEGVRIRTFLVVHPAWSYLASDYALQQVAIEHEGKSPGPKRIARLVERATLQGITTVFSERQFSSRVAEVIAHELGGYVVKLDPLAEDVLENLRLVGKLLVEAMQ